MNRQAWVTALWARSSCHNAVSAERCPRLRGGVCRVRSRGLIKPARTAHRFTVCARLSSDEGGSPTSQASTNISGFRQVTESFTKLFPVWSLLTACVALRFPATFSSIGGERSGIHALSILMLSMGLTLSPADLLQAFQQWQSLLLALFSCYILMPVIAVAFTVLLRPPRDFAVGLMLLSMVSGGQASNLCTYIAQGDVAQAVAMTTLSTLCVTFMLPLLSKIFIGTLIGVDALAIGRSTLEVVLMPITLGAALNIFAPKAAQMIEPLLPVTGIVATLFIVLVSIAKTSAALTASLPALLFPVAALHALGGIFGYMAAKVLRMDEKSARTISIQACFKSPALSFFLAAKHFSSYDVRVPSTISILVLVPLASAFAVFLRSRPIAPAPVLPEQR